MRNAIPIVLLLIALPGAAALAQSKNLAPGGTPAQLTPDEYERLMTRIEGAWVFNRAKSTAMVGESLPVPEGYTYRIGPDRKGVYFTSAGASSSSYAAFDGKPHGSPRGFARFPIDEFTVENIGSENGRRRSSNTQFYSPDGTKVIHIVRRQNAEGVETIVGTALYEKAPGGTPALQLPASEARPAASTVAQEKVATDAVIAADNRWANAYATCDAKTWNELFADDTTFIHAVGNTDDKAGMLVRLKDCPMEWVANEVHKVRLYGDVAIVNGSMQLRRKGATTIGATVYTRTYVRQNGAWRIAAHQSTAAPKPAP